MILNEGNFILRAIFGVVDRIELKSQRLDTVFDRCFGDAEDVLSCDEITLLVRKPS